MPAPREIQRGETLDALPSEDWNLFCKAARRILSLPGTGNGSGVASGSGVELVAIIADIAACTWDKTTKKKTRVEVTSPIFFPHPDNDETDTIDPDITMD